MNENEILREAIEKYGRDAQILMCCEECGELITSLMQHYRGRVTDEDVATEIADVMIMCKQMSLLFGDEKVKEQKEYKLKRLTERLKTT